MFKCEIVDIEECLPLADGLPLGFGHFMFLYLDVVFACEVAECVPVGELLVLHDEIHRRAAFAAAEAFAYAFGA